MLALSIHVGKYRASYFVNHTTGYIYSLSLRLYTAIVNYIQDSIFVFADIFRIFTRAHPLDVTVSAS